MMRTPKIDKVKVGDYYVYTTEIEYIKNLDQETLIDEVWSNDFLGSNYNDEGELEDQGPGVHYSIDVNNGELPHFFVDAHSFATNFASSLRALRGENTEILNESAWIIAAQDEHTPYWHTHRRNIADPRLSDDDEQVDSTYSYSFYLNTPECGSPFSDLLFAHKDDVFSMPITTGKLCLFDGDIFHKPQLVPKEFGWRYCIAGDILYKD